MVVTTLGRRRILGYRAAAQGLDRTSAGRDRVLALGVQDTPYGSARDALAARSDDAAAEHDSLVLVWSWRGAPHLHRPGDLAFLAAALWPVNDTDATTRIGTGQIREGAQRGLRAFTEAAEAMGAALTGPMTKGELSAAVSAAVPADLTYHCPSCRTRHISGALFQQVGLAARVRVCPQGRSTHLDVLPAGIGPDAVPERAEGTAAALHRYADVLAPVTPAGLAAFLGTDIATIRAVLPDDLVPVNGPAGKGLVPAAAVADLDGAADVRATRLLPPGDPWLQARDREFLVPERARRKRSGARSAAPVSSSSTGRYEGSGGRGPRPGTRSRCRSSRSSRCPCKRGTNSRPRHSDWPAPGSAPARPWGMPADDPATAPRRATGCRGRRRQ
ncbi:DNA glycosylase AlkZ-like family protein [Rhodococcus aetherivorans]|uniref:DNA glycosylase AlkZ-like family protein n=1 Tax=Rhodococcus aetherivorans TaxID=191292 RepID=UPI001C8B9155|nr:crosslink repair DNA glycosylase YcaQ family protein [Rhodococcus aetherivorans]